MSASIVHRDVDKARRIKRSALALGLLVVAFYVGFIVWSMLVG